MTEQLYYNDSYLSSFRAKILSCEEKNGVFEVILDRTAFFPEGGGQPGDRGVIGACEVIDTKLENGEIIHLCRGKVSGEVDCSIDWKFRFSNMQQHTGEHIFSGVLHSLTGFDNVGFHMGKEEVTVDFNGAVNSETLALAERKTNEFIYKNAPVTCFYPAQDEIKNYDYRSKKEVEGALRLVEIEGADLCACCGTHVRFAGEVGMVKVITSENYKGGVRITLKIGEKALEDYIEKNNSVLEISSALCAKYGEVSQAVKKLQEKQNDLRIELYKANEKIAELTARDYSEARPFVFDSSSDPETARMAANIGAKKVETAFAFSGNDGDGYKYVVSSLTRDVRPVSKELNSFLEGRGGGKPEMAMGSVKARRAEIEEFLLKNFANGGNK